MKLISNIILPTFCIFIIGTTVYSQSKDKLSASERRKIEKKAALDTEIFGADDNAFKVTSVPEKWANESAVVIAKSYHLTYLYDVFPKEELLYRNRVKLIDQAAVDFFSEFYFVSGSEPGIKIIKSSGKEILVNVMDAIEVDNKVKIPRFFMSNRSYKYKKLAISNLEPGDIIDYYYKSVYLSEEPSKKVFTPVIYNLNDEYPIINQKIEFEVPQKNFYLNFNSYNGAAKLVEKDNPKKKTKSYLLEAKDCEKALNLRWFYENIQSPTIKFQVTYVRPKFKSGTFFFFGEMGLPKSSVTKQELVDYLYDKLIAPSSFIAYDPIFQKVKSRKLDKTPDNNEFVIDLYYYLRHLFIVSKGYESEAYYTNNLLFAMYYKQILDFYNIDAELLVTVPRGIGNIDDALLTQELIFAVKVMIDQKVYYVCNPDRHSNITEIAPNIEGTDYYKINNISESKENRFPASPYAQNNTLQDLKIGVTDDFETFNVEKVTLAKGHNKYEFFNRVLIYDDYAPKENVEYGTTEFGVVKGKKKQAEVDRKVKDRIKEDEKERLKWLEDDVKASYDLISYDKFELLNAGRTYDDQVLAFKEEFKIKSLIKKAGKNYLFEIGKLLTSQIELEEKEMKRKYDIYMPYARSFEYVYRITLPKGYKVEGLEDMNVSIQNVCGGVTCEALKIADNEIKIKVKKYYSHNYEPKENWAQMVKFLELAYSITQKKLLLKKAS